MPLGALSAPIVQLLANWTGKRYTRPAFPDEFNRRRKACAQIVAKSARECAHDISSFYIILKQDRELLDDEMYEIILIGTVMANIATDPTRFGRAVNGVSAIAKAFTGSGITVIEATTRSEDEVSLTDVRGMLRLDLNYVSVRENAGEELYP